MTKNITELIRPAIRNIRPYSSARDEFDAENHSMIFLDANENPFQNGLNRYPDPGQRRLKERLAELRSLKEDQILMGNGSDEVLDLIVKLFCEPGKDAIMVLPPTYGMYEVIANVNVVDVERVPLDMKFQPDVEAILEAATEQVKIIFLCSPNNPSGNTMNADGIEKLLNGFNGIVVIDEAYIEFSRSESWLKKLKTYPNLIVTQTFSKAFGMAGIRLGMCYADEEIIRIMSGIKFPYNVNQATQEKALDVLGNMKIIESQVQTILGERDLLIDELSQISFITKVFPSDANFLLVRTDDADLRYSQLIENGIVVRNRNGLANCENCLRITIGTPKENTILIQTLKSLE